MPAQFTYSRLFTDKVSWQYLIVSLYFSQSLLKLPNFFSQMLISILSLIQQLSKICLEKKQVSLKSQSLRRKVQVVTETKHKIDSLSNNNFYCCWYPAFTLHQKENKGHQGSFIFNNRQHTQHVCIPASRTAYKTQAKQSANIYPSFGVLAGTKNKTQSALTVFI